MITTTKNKRKKNIIAILVLLSLSTLFSGMVNNKIKINNIPSKVVKTYIPKASSKLIVNPYMGFAPFADNSIENFAVPISTVYASVSWRELETQKGIYNFKNFEEKYKFNYWASKGVTIIMRFYMDYPSEKDHMDIPDWLYTESSKKGWKYSDTQNNRKGFSPDYSNKAIIENHRKIISAMAKRYDNDSRIAYIELGSIGHWGEWHTVMLEQNKNSFPKTNITDKYIKDYIDFYKNKKLLIRRPFDIAKKNNIGLFNDVFGDPKQTNSFLSWINNGYTDNNIYQKLPAMPNYWKETPSGGEFADAPGTIYIKDNNFNTILKMLGQSHISWLGPSAPILKKNIQPGNVKKLEKMLMNMGYRFSIEKSEYTNKIKAGDILNGKITITNQGIAPFYYNWPIQLSIIDSNNKKVGLYKLNTNITKLLPGKNKINYLVRTNKKLCAGNYKITLAVLNPYTKKPGIEFANKQLNEPKTYEIGALQIIK